MQKHSLFFLIFMVVLLPQCSSNTNKQTKNATRTIKHVRGYRKHSFVKTQDYTAVIDGVECQLCAQSAVALVKTVDGVVNAFYRKGQDYEDGVLEFAWDIKRGDVEIAQLDAVLKNEEFSVESIKKVAST